MWYMQGLAETFHLAKSVSAYHIRHLCPHSTSDLTPFGHLLPGRRFIGRSGVSGTIVRKTITYPLIPPDTAANFPRGRTGPWAASGRSAPRARAFSLPVSSKNLPLFGSSLPERGSFYPIIPESPQKASGRFPAGPRRRGSPVRRHPGRRGSNTPGWPDSLRSRQGRCLRTAAPSGKAAGQHRC